MRARTAAASPGPTDLELAQAVCSADLGAYVAAMWPRFSVARHHKRLLDALERVERGESDRVIVTMPPRHGKSLIVSQHFPAWFLGRNPQREVICATYAQEKADDWGREVRNQFADPLFQAIFPGVSLRADSKAARRFKTPQGGSFFAAGRNASITGRGAGVFVVDDPLKGREEADSPTIREKLKSWYSSVVYTRLDPGGAIVLVATRWHDDDLIGWVLREHAHERWEVIDFPAITERGGQEHALWPERFNLDWLQRRRRTLTDRDLSALYQQKPQADEGGIIKRASWKPWTAELPRPMMVVISVDTAFTEKDENDRSACTVWWLVGDERDQRQALLLRYAWAKRLEFAALVQEVQDTARHFGVKGIPLRLLVEAKASGLSVIQELRRRAPEISVWAVNPLGDKVARAYAAQPAFEAGKVFAIARMETVGDEKVREPVFRPWAREVIDECAAFPRGTLADLVDSTTQAIGHLRQAGVTFFPEDDPPPPAVDARGLPRGGQGTPRRGLYGPVGR
jgi:predicted phage terminase large subunit-like protein